jgi:cell pole-organizing protein PopZ
MEEILASIRRILTEEENERAASGGTPEPEDEVLVLGSGMVSGGEPPVSAPPLPPEPDSYEPPPGRGRFGSEPQMHVDDFGALPPDAVDAYLPASVVEPTPTAYPATLAQKEEFMPQDQVQSPLGLVSDQAASEIANTVGSLVRSVSADRSVGIGRAGVTIEDLVREEIKPVLKSWLDSHLPSLVERVVRAEIGRVIDRMGS